MEIEAIRDVIQAGIKYEKETQQLLTLLKKQPELTKKVIRNIQLENIVFDSDKPLVSHGQLGPSSSISSPLTTENGHLVLDLSILVKTLLLRYISQVPDMLKGMLQAADHVGFRLQVESTLGICEKYFLNKPLNRERPKGVQNLLMDAYVAYRVIEEVNAHFVMRMGLPLIALDMSETTKIVRGLIPYTLASKLDSLVLAKVDKCLTEPMPDLLAG